MDKASVSGGENQLAGNRILAVTEEELQRLILNLHDGPVQQLFAAQSQLRILQTLAAREEGEVAPKDCLTAVNRASLLLESALGEIRQFLGAFRPPDFARRDLVTILRGLLLHYEMATGCEVDFAAPTTAVSAPLPVKICLYRICQEALFNAYHHAEADRQTVRLSEADDAILLEVSDNGVGFTPPPLRGPDATEREEHIGLRGMRDRVDLIGGDFLLESAPGQGTRITVKAPLNE